MPSWSMCCRRALATLLEAVKMDTLSESLDTAMVRPVQGRAQPRHRLARLCRRLSQLRAARGSRMQIAWSTRSQALTA